jgi:hypothetical protein
MANLDSSDYTFLSIPKQYLRPSGAVNELYWARTGDCHIEEPDNLPTLYSFDVVDFRKVSPGFREEALKEVEYFN